MRFKRPRVCLFFSLQFFDRYGTETSFGDATSWTWRCLACITPKQAKNVINDSIEIGFDADIPEETREQFNTLLAKLAADEDASETLTALTGVAAPEGEKPKKKSKPKRSIDEIQADADKDGFSALSMDELKQLLKEKKLKVSGKKDELVQRLEDAKE